MGAHFGEPTNRLAPGIETFGAASTSSIGPAMTNTMANIEALGPFKWALGIFSDQCRAWWCI